MISEEKINKLREFFMGPVYPLIVCFMMFLGHVFAIEFYLNVINISLLFLAFCVCNSIRPFIVVLCTYTFQVALENAPGSPTFSDFYFSGARLWIAVVFFVLAGAGLVYYVVRNKLVTKKSLGSLPLLFSLPVFAAAFLMNGAFSEEWAFSSLVYGSMQILCYYIIFYIFYLGLREENMSDLLSYFAYVSMLIILLLVAETAHMLFTAEGAIVDGVINRSVFHYGWGNTNVMAVNLVIPIPMLFYGVMKNKHWWAYLATAVLGFVAIAIALSRNSLLFGGLAIIVCLVICCLVGERRKLLRIVIPSVVAVIAVILLIFKEPILTALTRYEDAGFSDNGRFNIWKYGFEEFLKSPVFGKGFFGLKLDMSIDAEFLPFMMHNTPIQLLGATGAVGTIAYGLYRIDTVKPFLRKPSLGKTMLGIAAALLVLTSLLDNFIFYIQQTFYYSIALAMVFRIYFNEKSEGEEPGETKPTLISRLIAKISDKRTKSEEKE